MKTLREDGCFSDAKIGKENWLRRYWERVPRIILGKEMISGLSYIPPHLTKKCIYKNMQRVKFSSADEAVYYTEYKAKNPSSFCQIVDSRQPGSF